MAENQSDAVRSVAWSELFPWLSILRVFRLAVTVRALALGAAGILLTSFGWCLIAWLLCQEVRSPDPGDAARPTMWLKPYAECPWRGVTRMTREPAGCPISNRCAPASADPKSASVPLPCDASTAGGAYGACWWREPVVGTWSLLTRPALSSLSKTAFGRRDAVTLILCGLWGTFIWSFFGLAICRIAAVKLAADEQIGWGDAMRFAGRKWPSSFAAPLLPIAIVVVLTIVILVLGLIMRANAGLLLVGIFLWPLVLVAAFVMAVLLLGALFGWPLMWSAIAAEGSDTFDALSRSYAYVFQRPLRYLFYIAVAAFLGWLGWLAVLWFTEGVIYLAYWAAGWGCGDTQLGLILNSAKAAEDGLSNVGVFGARATRFWASCLRLAAVGYLFSYFWTASTAIYFLLRRDVDSTEMDEVFLDADATEQEPAPPTVANASDDPPIVDADPK